MEGNAMGCKTCRTLSYLFLIAAIMMCVTSCTLTKRTSATTDASAPAPQQPMENYYDFDDVAVPQEMSLRSRESFILETPSTRTGVMVFTGKVEAISLRNYYVNTMAKDGWSMRSAIKSSKSLLVFEKPDKYAVIIINDGNVTTRLEIWIAPRSGAIGDTGYTTMDPGASLVQ